jgi:hypothetical protein
MQFFNASSGANCGVTLEDRPLCFQNKFHENQNLIVGAWSDGDSAASGVVARLGE